MAGKVEPDPTIVEAQSPTHFLLFGLWSENATTALINETEQRTHERWETCTPIFSGDVLNTTHKEEVTQFKTEVR